MSNHEIMQELGGIIAERFEYDGPVTAETVASQVEGWDSIAHVDLVLLVEERFGIRLTTGETANLPNVGALAAAIERHLQR